MDCQYNEKNKKMWGTKMEPFEAPKMELLDTPKYCGDAHSSMTLSQLQTITAL